MMMEQLLGLAILSIPTLIYFIWSAGLFPTLIVITTTGIAFSTNPLVGLAVTMFWIWLAHIRFAEQRQQQLLMELRSMKEERWL